MASAPFVSSAAVPATHTTAAAPDRTAIEAAVIWPRSPHSVKKTLAKAMRAPRRPLGALPSTSPEAPVAPGRRCHRAAAVTRNVAAVTPETSRAGSVEMTRPSTTAPSIFPAQANARPRPMLDRAYRPASAATV